MNDMVYSRVLVLPSTGRELLLRDLVQKSSELWFLLLTFLRLLGLDLLSIWFTISLTWIKQISVLIFEIYFVYCDYTLSLCEYTSSIRNTLTTRRYAIQQVWRHVGRLYNLLVSGLLQ